MRTSYVLLTWKEPKTGLVTDFQFDVVTTETYEAVMQVTSHPVERGAPITDHARPEPITLSLEGFISDTPLPTNISKFGTDLESKDWGYLPTPLDYSLGEGTLQVGDQSFARRDGASIFTPGGATQALGKLLSKGQPLPSSVQAWRRTDDASSKTARSKVAIEKLEKARVDKSFVEVTTKHHHIENMIITRISVPRTTESSGGIEIHVDLTQVRLADTQVVSYEEPAMPRAAKEVKKGVQVPDSFLYAPTKKAFESVDDFVEHLSK